MKEKELLLSVQEHINESDQKMTAELAKMEREIEEKYNHKVDLQKKLGSSMVGGGGGASSTPA